MESKTYKLYYETQSGVFVFLELFVASGSTEDEIGDNIVEYVANRIRWEPVDSKK